MSVSGLDVRFIQRNETLIPDNSTVLAIQQNNVVDTTEVSGALSNIIVSTVPLPDNFVPEVGMAEHSIHQQLEVVACGGITVEVDATRWFEDSVQLDQALRHHREICHQVVPTEEGEHCSKQLTDLAALLCHNILVGPFGRHLF